jgi:hypothetical protein
VNEVGAAVVVVGAAVVVVGAAVVVVGAAVAVVGSDIDNTPLQFVPLSSVMKTRMSTPAAVKEGAVPPGHFTEAGQVIAVDPPFVNLNMNPLALDED